MNRLYTHTLIGAFFILLASCSSGKTDSEQTISIQPNDTPTLTT
ncbi:MAG: hypothetical protein PHE03_12040 [Bacteroidales bacterium]|nr:hypothetical protein [Bacteroidales bacterium]MDD3893021.1 hypothetical protein [Bacteroidales bacterium]